MGLDDDPGPEEPCSRLAEFVPAVEVASLDCGHWIQHEKPEEVDQLILIFDLAEP